MASTTIYCPSVKMWNASDDYWENYNYTISGSYKDKPLSIVPPRAGVRLGLQRMEFDALPIGTIIAATLHWRSYCYGASYYSKNVYFRASGDPDAWHNTEPPNTIYQSADFINGVMTDYSLDITTHINSYGVAGSALYIFAFVTVDVYPANLASVWHYSGYMPYIEIEYTTAATDSKFYLGTASGNKVAEMYIGVGGAVKQVTDIYIGTSSGNKRVEL